MEHKEFIEKLQKKSGKDKKSTERLVSYLSQILKDKCSGMDTVSIQGFGSFEPKKKMEREVINPATGSKMLIPPKIVLGFKPATAIKNKLKEIKSNEQ